MNIDTKELNSRHNLIDLAGGYTTLRSESRHEYSGPCPNCSGEDRFHVKADLWFCRQCYPLDNGQPHDAIAFVQFLGLATDFKAACDLLAGGALPPASPALKPAPKATDLWRSVRWQREVQALLAEGQDRLWNRADGERGRRYLAGRGFRDDVALAFGLGYAHVWHPKCKERRPAILLPWQNRLVSAVQYRFIDSDLSKTARYAMKGGGRRLLFGMPLLHYGGADTLVFCEGEFNAAAIWQVVFAERPVHVLSWGPEHNMEIAPVAALAARVARDYRRVIVWADEPERAIGAINALGLPGAVALRSPRGQDACDLLQAGRLVPFVEQLLDQYPLPGTHAVGRKRI